MRARINQPRMPDACVPCVPCVCGKPLPSCQATCAFIPNHSGARAVTRRARCYLRGPVQQPRLSAPLRLVSSGGGQLQFSHQSAILAIQGA